MNKRFSVPRVIFAGGGGEADSRPLDELFASWVGPEGRLLYLPTALVDLPNFTEGYHWIQSVFAPLGLTKITMWADLSGKTTSDLAQFDAVYIGGGNTFYLLHQLRIHHLVEPLAEFIRNGHPAYGGSAGAIVLSRDITPCTHIDPDIVGLNDLRALDLSVGWSIWCHYTPADDDRIRAYQQAAGAPCAACSERSGVYRLRNHLYAGGYEPVIVFANGERHVVEPGAQL